VHVLSVPYLTYGINACG